MIIPDLLNDLPKGLTVKTIETAKRLFAATLWGRDPLLNVTLDNEMDDGEVVDLWDWLDEDY